MPTTIRQPLPGFLEDWRPDHRVLSDELRQHVARYIQAIVGRNDPESRGTVAVAGEARELWARFRVAYDDLRGEYQRSDHEDVGRALARI